LCAMHLPWALHLFLYSSHFSVIIWGYTSYDGLSPEALSMNFSTVPITTPHSFPPLYIVSTCNHFVSRSRPVTLQTERVHVHYEQTVALMSYHQNRMIQTQALVHRNIYSDESSSGLCLYTAMHLCPKQYVSSPC
jgi:hypothetical protein